MVLALLPRLLCCGWYPLGALLIMDRNSDSTLLAKSISCMSLRPAAAAATAAANSCTAAAADLERDSVPVVLLVLAVLKMLLAWDIIAAKLLLVLLMPLGSPSTILAPVKSKVLVMIDLARRKLLLLLFGLPLWLPFGLLPLLQKAVVLTLLLLGCPERRNESAAPCGEVAPLKPRRGVLPAMEGRKLCCCELCAALCFQVGVSTSSGQPGSELLTVRATPTNAACRAGVLHPLFMLLLLLLLAALKCCSCCCCCRVGEMCPLLLLVLLLPAGRLGGELYLLLLALAGWRVGELYLLLLLPCACLVGEPYLRLLLLLLLPAAARCRVGELYLLCRVGELYLLLLLPPCLCCPEAW